MIKKEREEHKVFFLGWLNQGLDKHGKTNMGLANVLGIAPAQVGKMARGLRDIKAYELEGISKYIEEPIPTPPRAFRGRGKKGQAGFLVTHDIDECPVLPRNSDQNGSAYRLDPDGKFPLLPRFAARVKTNALDLKIAPGSFAIYVSYWDARPKGIETGDLIIAEIKHKADGSEVITPILRQIISNGTGFALVCASSDVRRHSSIIQLDRHLKTKSGDVINIIGLITYAVELAESAEI